MVRKDGAEARKERLQKVAQIIQATLHKEEGQISLSKTIAALQYDLGLTRDKTMEYLDILEKIGQFSIDQPNDRITKNQTS